MTRQTRPASVRGRTALWLLPVLAACAPLEPPPSQPLPRPTLAAVERAHSVYFATDSAALSAQQSRDLARFLAALPESGRAVARVIGHADRRAGDAYNIDLSRRRAATVARVLQEAGVDPVEVTVLPMGETMAEAAIGDVRGMARDREVEIVIAGDEVVLPGCPNWTRDPGFDPLNLPLSNLGCANAVNLGLMVADPTDLATGHPTSPADGAREAEAIVRYRTDKVKQLQADIIQ
jgi:pilus assembly protein CpaD